MQQLNYIKVENPNCRDEYELFNMSTLAAERINLNNNASYSAIKERLKVALSDWQWKTNDPWRCAPDGVLQDAGKYKNNPECQTLNIPKRAKTYVRNEF